MNNKILAACSGVILAASLVAPQVSASQSYVAKLDEDGRYCARVEVRGPAGLTMKKTKCRTISEWKAAGYLITSAPKVAALGE